MTAARPAQRPAAPVRHRGSTRLGGSLWNLLRRTLSECDRHETTRLGASLAFYAVLSLAPLVVLAIALAGLVVGTSAAQTQVLAQFRELLGNEGAEAVRSMIAHAQNMRATSIASVLGIATLLFGASQIFSELQSALNKIWEAESYRTGGLVTLIRQRFFSFGLVLAIGLLLLVSLLLSAALSGAGKYMHGVLPLPEWILQCFDFLVSIAGASALFALIFQYIPDPRTRWRCSWIGGVCTAALFSLGKFLIGLYIGKASIGIAYGEAGSLVVVIVWVYYSSQIFYFGAELTHVLSMQDCGVTDLKPGRRARAISSPRSDSLPRVVE